MLDTHSRARRTLYPEIDPYESGMLDVGDGHSLYWELSGNPNGKPVVFLHGGPGGGSSPDHRRQFNPEKYKILVFDQYEIDWMYKEGGASQLYPDKFEEFLAPIAASKGGDLVEAYRKLLTSDDKDVQLRAAKAWSKWEGDIVTLLPSPETIEHFTSPEVAVAVARIENHYMASHGWLEEGQLLRGAEKLRGIPGIIVQGRHDCCTPPVAAWRLKRAWPEVELNLVPDGGHLFNEPGVLDGLIRATDRFAGL